MNNNDLTTEQVTRSTPNPSGIGGFADNPENINRGGRPKNIQRYDYWLQYFKDMVTSDFEAYIVNRPTNMMYVAEAQAYECVSSAFNDVKVWAIIASRTEGKPGNVNVAPGMGDIKFINDLPRPILGGLSIVND